MAAPSPLPTYIYKILPTEPPQPLPAALPLSELDKNDGFIHLSTSDQVAATASRFFTKDTKLWILKLQLDTFPADAKVGDLGQIKWEAAKSHGVFPHLYDGDLGAQTVQEVLAFEREDGQDWNTVLNGLQRIIDIGKLGSFPANSLLGRPYHYTYELREPLPDEKFSRLRVVPAHELNADVLAEDGAPGEPDATPDNEVATNGESTAYDPTTESRNNRLTLDDPTRQTLTHTEIEELKRTAGGQEIIDRITANHTGLDEKTAYSKAKYLLRKRTKYLKRFTVLPVDVPVLVQYIASKESLRILDLRDETLALLTAWSNVHVSPAERVPRDTDGKRVGGGRWLAVDETGGLLAAALAERMQILYPRPTDDTTSENKGTEDGVNETNGTEDGANENIEMVNGVNENDEPENGANGTNDANGSTEADHPPEQPAEKPNASKPSNPPVKAAIVHEDFLIPAETNTITLIHPGIQPNISMLKYFGYDSNEPDPKHPLHRHLKSLSWLQLLHPEEDPTYIEPAVVQDTQLKEWRSGKRGAYWRKRRRWQRCKFIVDETREGGFDGLVVATPMDPVGILEHTVPLLRGGATIAIHSPTAEVLVSLMDLYSKERRTAYVQHLTKGETPDPEDFPLDPRQLLAPMLQTSRVRPYQVLPGRTHPLMTHKGGPEGFVFTARKAIPLEGGVEARGTRVSKRRKVNAPDDDA